MLREAGFENALCARTIDDARAIMAHHASGLLLCDWPTKGEEDEAIRMVRRLREEERHEWRRAPVLMISSPRGRRDIERARDAGVTEFLIKPLSPIDLWRRIDAIRMSPRLFVEAERFRGPDRRRRPRREAATKPYKRTRDVQDGLVSAIEAAQAAAVAFAEETVVSGDPLAIRVGRSLRRYMSGVAEYGPRQEEVVEMHRAALAQLVRLDEAGERYREPVVSGLEEVVAKQQARAA
jgi:DNA-binding response OmpR family regulator